MVGTLLLRQSRHKSLRSAFALAGPRGEFSIVIVKAGVDIGAVSSFVFPLIGIITIISAFVSPFLIRASDKIIPKIAEEKKLSEDEMKKLMDRVHMGVTSFNYNGIKVPCLILSEKRFDQIMAQIAGKPLSVETNLNILQDGLGHVFVEISLMFSEGGIEEKLLLYANESLGFFESLASTSMLALSSPHSEIGKDNVFMIQLPRPEKITSALDIIKQGLSSKNQSKKP
jgi:hypothetical protein